MPLRLEIPNAESIQERFLIMLEEALEDAKDATNGEVRMIAAALAARLVEVANG